MKKILPMLIFLFTIYYIIELLFLFFGPGYKLNYQLETTNNKFSVEETYYKGDNDELTNYYIKVSKDDMVFNYQIIDKNTFGKKIIKNIKYYSDDKYQCILPLFKGIQIQYDITCFHDQKQDYYYNLRNTNEGLDKFAKDMEVYGYNVNNFINDEETFEESNSMLLYNNNIIGGYNLAITMRKSAYTSSDNYQKFTRTDFFSRSAIVPQTTPIRTFVKNFIVIADYSMKDSFNQFILVNRDGNNKSLVATPNISFNSYIQGVVNNSFYLIDRDAKKQYEINIKDRTAVVVGTPTSGSKYYHNGVWEILDFNESLNNNIYFNEYVSDVTKDFSGYSKVIKYGGEDSGYYYFFKSNNGKYDVYYANVKDKNTVIYLFTSTITNIKYAQDYLYFVDNDTIKYYNHRTGLRTLAKSPTEEIVDYSIYYDK